MVINDEEKRTRTWSVVTLVSTLVVLALIIFLLIRLFTTNPLQGTWESDDGTLELKIGSAAVKATEMETDEKADFSYSVDRSDKIVTFDISAENDENIEDSILQNISSSFSYSVDGDVMTLTEREYGEQYIFYKQ
ncbi:MAG: hypothetical protein ACK5LL_13910 [Suipraeoptans sp.]